MDEKLNILFVGDLNEGGRSLQRCKTLQKLGHDLTAISSSPVPFIGGVNSPTLLERIFWKLKLPLDSAGVNRSIFANINAKSFDMIWIDKGVTVRPRTLRYIKKNLPKSAIIFCSEDNMFKKFNQTLWYLWGIKYYDIVFTTKPRNLSELRTLGAKRTEPFLDSYDEELHRPVTLSDTDKKKFGCDVGFIGFFEKERAEAILYLAKNDIKVTVYGIKWEEWKGSHPNVVINKYPIYGDDYVKAMNATKINLCFLRKINQDEITSRSVEIPACGAFMLGERTPRHLDFFVEGKEAEFFDSREEMLKKVKYYLDNDTQREKIAKAGRERCISSGYSMMSQLDKMVKTIVKTVGNYAG